MAEIIIDEEFKSILPALDKKTYALLAESLLQNGCMHPLVLWDGVLIDGHNRYDICMKHGIPFTTVSMEFESRDAVLIWIIGNQISRRNLNPIQLSYYRGQHYISDKRIHGDSDRFSKDDPYAQNGHMGESTATRLAKHYKVSRNTIRRDAKTAEAINVLGKASPAAKKDILSGDVSITRKHLNELLAGSEEDILETATKIEEGSFERKRPANSASNGGGGFNGLDLAGLEPLYAAIIQLSDGFSSDLRRLVKVSNAAGLKTTIRSFITALEDLYGQL